MATQTTHYNLKKPDLSDLVKVSDLNDNFDTIDEKIYEAMQSGGSATGMIEQAVESSATSAHAYAVGEHFIYNDTLYEATAAIDIGDTITPGTNCDAVTVAGELEGKVDKVAGMGLSHNDLTDTLKGKINGAVQSTEKGAVNGIAELDASGKVPSAQLPSYVDDVIEGYYYNGSFYSDQAHTSAISPEQGKIYVDITDPNNSESYRWSGSAFVKISNPIDIDDTLTQQGKAADAKAAGDAINLRAKTEDVEAGTEAKKSYHLGFYYDEEGYLCQN